jgi:hypothetical protein
VFIGKYNIRPFECARRAASRISKASPSTTKTDERAEQHASLHHGRQSFVVTVEIEATNSVKNQSHEFKHTGPGPSTTNERGHALAEDPHRAAAGVFATPTVALGAAGPRRNRSRSRNVGTGIDDDDDDDFNVNDLHAAANHPLLRAERGSAPLSQTPGVVRCRSFSQ